MKELFLNPIILIFLVTISIVFFGLLAKKISGNRKISLIAEYIFVFFTFLIISEIQIFPFYRLHPAVLVETSNLASWILQVIVFSLIVILLSNSFFYFPKALTTLYRDLALGALILLLMLSAFWSETPEFTFQKSLGVLIVTFLGAHIAYRNDWSQLSRYFRWSTTTVAFLSILFAIFMPSIGIRGGRWNGVLQHPLDLGSLMSLSSVMWFAHAIHNKPYRRSSLIFACISLFVLLMASSGGGIGTFLVLLILLGLTSSIKRLNWRNALLLNIAYIIIGVLIFSSVMEILNFIIIDLLGKDLTLTGRTDFWPQLIEKVEKKPFVGYGYSGFWQDWRGLDSPSSDIISGSGFIPRQAHNGFLDLALNLGLFGLFLFLTSYTRAIFLSILYIVRSKLSEAELPIILLAYTLMSNISNSFLLSPRFIWFSFTILVVRLNIDAKKSIKTPSFTGFCVSSKYFLN